MSWENWRKFGCSFLIFCFDFWFVFVLVTGGWKTLKDAVSYNLLKTLLVSDLSLLIDKSNSFRFSSSGSRMRAHWHSWWWTLKTRTLMMHSPVYPTKKAPAFCITWRGSLEGLVRIRDYYLIAFSVYSVKQIVTKLSQDTLYRNYYSPGECGFGCYDAKQFTVTFTFPSTFTLTFTD